MNRPGLTKNASSKVKNWLEMLMYWRVHSASSPIFALHLIVFRKSCRLLSRFEESSLRILFTPTYAWISASVLLLCLNIWNIGSLLHWQQAFVESTEQLKITVPEDHLPESLNFPFFGLYQSSLSDEAIVHSQLNYVIVGIMFSSQPQLSQAVIRDEAGVEKLYHVGDPLSMGVMIKAIEPFRIVVSNQGNLESLNLRKDVLRFDSPPKPFMMQEPE